MRPLLPYQQLLSSAGSLTTKYERLKSKFSDFAEHCAQLSTQGPVPDVVIEKHVNEGYFDATFVGRRFRFQFALQLDKEGNGMGFVICSEVLPKELRKIYEFTVAENGDTNVKPPDASDYIGCDARMGAWYLLVHALHEGLTT